MAEGKAFDPRAYTITVRHIVVDGAALFRATVAELPDVAEFADSYEEAYTLAVDTIEGLKESAASQQRPFPEPFADEDAYSGRVTFRMPKSVHRLVAEHAKAEGVSLNAFLMAVVAEKVGHIRGRGESVSSFQIYRGTSIGPATGQFGITVGNLSTASLSSAGTLITAVDLGANVLVGGAAHGSGSGSHWLPALREDADAYDD